jgi:hypothetical protein
MEKEDGEWINLAQEQSCGVILWASNEPSVY